MEEEEHTVLAILEAAERLEARAVDGRKGLPGGCHGSHGDGGGGGRAEEVGRGRRGYWVAGAGVISLIRCWRGRCWILQSEIFRWCLRAEWAEKRVVDERLRAERWVGV